MKKMLRMSIFMLLIVALIAGCGNAQNTSSSSNSTSSSNTTSNSSGGTSGGQSDNNNASEEQKTEVNFPEKQLTLVITNAAGGGVDLVARSVQPYLEKQLGVPIIIENMPGAGGAIAASKVWNADPDGHTLLITYIPSIQLSEIVQGDAAEFKSDEFEHLYNWYGGDSLLLAVPKDSKYQTVDDLLEEAKNKTLKFSGAGRGTTGHLASIVGQNVVGIDHSFIPFDSGPESVAAALGGQVDGVFTTGSTASRNEEVRVIATFSPERLALFPDVPTFEELGYDGALVPVAGGAMATPGTPPEVLEILETALTNAVNDPEYQKWAEESDYPLQQLDSKAYFEMSKKLYDLASEYSDLLTE